MKLLTDEVIEDIDQEQKLLLVKQVRRWGDLNTDAILDSNCKIFSAPDINGFICYRREENHAIVFGDPLCPLKDQLPLAQAFQSYCKEQDLNVVYAIISEQFARSALNQIGNVLIQFGYRLIFDPTDNPLQRKGSKGAQVRKKVKRALSEGIVINEYFSDDPALEKSMKEVGQAWLQSRHGAQIYIAHLNFFNYREGKRWFYAKQGDRIMGFLILNEIQASSGWLLNNLIIASDAPPGTSELLITSVLETLEKENCKCVVVGPVTAMQIRHIVGMGTFSSWLIRAVFKAAKIFFRLDGQTVFWEKFQPNIEPSYVLFDKINFQALKALLRAMNAHI